MKNLTVLVVFVLMLITTVVSYAQYRHDTPPEPIRANDGATYEKNKQTTLEEQQRGAVYGNTYVNSEASDKERVVVTNQE